MRLHADSNLFLNQVDPAIRVLHVRERALEEEQSKNITKIYLSLDREILASDIRIL
jgi:hypothetical protein